MKVIPLLFEDLFLIPMTFGYLKMPSGTPRCRLSASAGVKRFALHSGLPSDPQARRGALGHFQDHLQAPGIRR